MSNRAKGKKVKRVITVLCILAVIIAGALIIPEIVSAKNDKTTALQAAGETRTVTVSTQDIRETISGSGQIVTGDEETLAPDEDLEVDEVLVKEGQAVKKGAALLTYTDGTEMTAPFNGIISTVSATAGSTESNSQNKSSGSIVIMSTETMVTQLSVDEADLKNIKTGQKADITVNAFPDEKYTGTVTKISETGEYSNGSSKFQVEIKLDKLDNVKIGMSSAVEIVVKSVTGAVAVPVEAVMGSGKNAYVMLVNSDGTASPAQVELGLANDAYVQIVSGLSVGDTVQYTVKTSNTGNNLGGFGSFGGGGGIQERMANGGGGRMSGGNYTQPKN